MYHYEQRTLKRSVALNGHGLHTGEKSRITLNPAAPDTGIVFISKGISIRAESGSVCDTRRGTNLGTDSVQIHTVEHLLSALAGMRIDNAIIEIDGLEVPAVDGSALPFVEMIEEAGIEGQSSPAAIKTIDAPAWAIHNDKCLYASPCDIFKASVLISFRHPMIGEQGATFCIDPETYKKEIAPARTFCTADEIEMILAQGLGKGGTEDNVIIVYTNRYSVPLRFNNELVRHKLLDLIGDLSLIGGRLHADVMGIRTSHMLNTDFANKISKLSAV